MSSSSFDNSISYFDAPVYRIGASMWNGNYHGGYGIIDDVIIWDRSLTAQEIQQLYINQNYIYNWSPNNETTSSITLSPSILPLLYTVNVTSGTSTTCQDSVTITVNPTPSNHCDSTACDSIQWDGNWLASSGTLHRYYYKM